MNSMPVCQGLSLNRKTLHALRFVVKRGRKASFGEDRTFPISSKMASAFQKYNLLEPFRDKFCSASDVVPVHFLDEGDCGNSKAVCQIEFSNAWMLPVFLGFSASLGKKEKFRFFPTLSNSIRPKCVQQSILHVESVSKTTKTKQRSISLMFNSSNDWLDQLKGKNVFEIHVDSRLLVTKTFNLEDEKIIYWNLLQYQNILTDERVFYWNKISNEKH